MNNSLPEIAKRENTIIGDKFRFTILTPRLIRLEYNKNGVFEDRATNRVIFRNFDKCIYSVTESQTIIEIKTSYFTLTYIKDKPFKTGAIAGPSTLKVLLNETDKEWYYGNKEVRNYGAINYSLDDYSGKLSFTKGLYSIDGFCTIDDSNSLVLSNNGYIERDKDIIDIYLFMYKRDFGLCLNDYYKLTGYPVMVPRYALGNWWYKNDKYNEFDVIEVVNKFKDKDIPLSVFLLGDYWHDNKNNYIFDSQLFPNISNVSNYLRNVNIKLGVTIDPSYGINREDKMYQTASQFGLGNGKINLTPVNPTSANIYYNLFIKPLESLGISLFNIGYNNVNDKNSLWYLENIHLNSNKLVLSRNSGISPHRYPIIFSGRTKINWETLNILPEYNASAANMGISFVAHPIGGFYGGCENEELYIRYIQFGVFSPVMILASEGGKYYKREPWKWNELIISVIRKYMKLRHKLIPYIYSEGYSYHKYGIPLIKPLYYQYPRIKDEIFYNNQYFFGSQFLVAPITKKKNMVMNRVVQKLFIPEGTWYDFFHGKKFNGNKYYISFYKDEDYPVFCKAGSIIPLSLEDGTKVPVNMEILIFPGVDNVYSLYEDDEYQNSSLIEITYKYKKDNYMLEFISKEKKGNLLEKRNYRLRFRNMKAANSISVTNNGSNIAYKAYLNKNDLLIEVYNISLSDNLKIHVMGHDMEISSERVINEEIKEVLTDLEINTLLKEKIDEIIFSDLSIKKKRIAIKKLKRKGLEPRFINVFINLLEYIQL